MTDTQARNCFWGDAAVGPSFPTHGAVFIPQNRSFVTGLAAGDREWGSSWWSRYTQCCGHTEGQCLSSGVSGGLVCTRLAICNLYVFFEKHYHSYFSSKGSAMSASDQVSWAKSKPGNEREDRVSLACRASVAQTLTPVAVTRHLSRIPRRKGCSCSHFDTQLITGGEGSSHLHTSAHICTHLGAEETKAELAWLPPFSWFIQWDPSHGAGAPWVPLFN